MFGIKRQSEIDKLVKQQAKLIVKRQKTIDRRNETNSKLETQIKKLEHEALRNQQIAEGIVAELERQIKKGKEQISLEAKYYNSVATDAKAVSLTTDVDL